MKMNWKSFVMLFGAVLMTASVSAQANLLNAKTPSDIGVKTAEQLLADNDKPLPYGYVDDRDVLWAKVVWEYIDLNERFPYHIIIQSMRTVHLLIENLCSLPYYKELKKIN